VVFPKERVAVFCDGDFWHGRDLDHHLEKLTRGHNAAYWTAKVKRNVERDRQNTSALSAAGWNVLRLWETEVLRETTKAADRIEALLADTRSHAHHRRAAPTASIESRGR
jgi:DNA mismatch endonuclease (patch repair protein)